MTIHNMASSTDHSSETSHLGPNSADKLFIAFLVLIVAAVTWLGVINYKEAIKVEAAKSNGEDWVAWLTETGTTRFEADTKHPACKGGAKAAADAKAGDPGTWGACLAHILANTELKDQVNTFFNKPPHFVAACDPKDRTLMGAILLEDLMPTPPGSATPFVASQLLETDSIDYKMQLRLSVCDKGGYAIKVAEFEF
ncbi:MAG: hypothetical protein RLZZ498_1245 [Pseudomonadota bacterium]|jgi:hypothetical protein